MTREFEIPFVMESVFNCFGVLAGCDAYLAFYQVCSVVPQE